MVRTQPSDMYIEITVLTLANIQHSHGICPITQLSWLSLEWTDVYTSSGGRKIDVMYIIDVYMYSLYQLSYHTPLNDDVCGMFMEFSVKYIIELYIFTLSSLSPHPPKDDVCDHQRSKWYVMYITAWHICQLSNLFILPQLPNVDAYDVFI